MMFTFRANLHGIRDKFIDSNLLLSSIDFSCGQNLAIQSSHSSHLKQKQIDKWDMARNESEMTQKMEAIIVNLVEM